MVARPSSDLEVEPLSQSLLGFELDLVVSGSIAAVESVRFIRSLRRLGARVFPWLTPGGKLFTTATALSWAAGGQKVQSSFCGEASHLAQRQALVIAPASANLIAKIAHGITDSPAAALAASYLGLGLPVLILANMHDSLFHSPRVQANLESLAPYATLLPARTEEGKQKFPQPQVLADILSHHLRRFHAPLDPVLISFGSTRGYIDDVRYVSNYSTGRLGSLIAEELYRLGHDTFVVAGSSLYRPHTFSHWASGDTHASMFKAIQQALDAGAKAAVLAAAVLDFEPEAKQSGKIASADLEHFDVPLRRVDKIIASVKPAKGVKVGFKLETSLDGAKAQAIARAYIPKYELSLMVLNRLDDVSAEKHKAYVIAAPSFAQGAAQEPLILDSKRELAHYIAKHVHEGLASS